jgi:hypothetical protein
MPRKTVSIRATVAEFEIEGDGLRLTFSGAQAAALDVAADMSGDVDVVVTNANRETHEYNPDAASYVDMTMTDADRRSE